ncbi:MAG: energy transducer TonB [Planctomycetes bacterium]|nr:energy transducer TonB [Planctomycetota bacterium]
MRSVGSNGDEARLSKLATEKLSAWLHAHAPIAGGAASAGLHALIIFALFAAAREGAPGAGAGGGASAGRGAEFAIRLAATSDDDLRHEFPVEVRAVVPSAAFESPLPSVAPADVPAAVAAPPADPVAVPALGVPESTPVHATAAAEGGAETTDSGAIADEGNPLPIYPARARRRGLQGAVTVRLTVDERGNVAEISTVAATGSSLFEDAVRHTVRRWRFRPARAGGRPVPAAVTQTFTFRIAEAAPARTED